MAFSRMPWRAHSTARLWVITATPALDIAEGTTKGLPVHTQVVRMLMTLDAYDARLALLGDPTLAASVGRVERAMQDDVGDGVEGARAEVLGLGNEIYGSQVDQS